MIKDSIIIEEILELLNGLNWFWFLSEISKKMNVW